MRPASEAAVNAFLDRLKLFGLGFSWGAAAVSNGDDGGQEGDAGKKRKINVRAPLYSLELLADREGMLQYLTGFDRESIDLLTQRLGEVVFLSPCF